MVLDYYFFVIIKIGRSPSLTSYHSLSVKLGLVKIDFLYKKKVFRFSFLPLYGDFFLDGEVEEALATGT